MSKKIKVALCVSGQMRTFRECFPSLKKYIIDVFNPDIFIHTWSDIGYPTDSIKDKNYYKNIDKSKGMVRKHDLVELFNPADLVIEDFKKEYMLELEGVKIPRELIEELPHDYKGLIPMYYKMYKCNELKKQKEEKEVFRYDLVIRARPDILFFEKIPENIMEKFEESNDTLFHTKGKKKGCVVDDRFAFSSSNMMDIYSGLWLKLNEYWRNPLGKDEKGNYDWCSIRSGERLIYHHLKNNDVTLYGFLGVHRIKRFGESVFYSFYKKNKIQIRQNKKIKKMFNDF